MSYFCCWYNKAMPPLSTASASCMRRGKACRKTMFVPVIGMKKPLLKALLMPKSTLASYI